MNAEYFFLSLLYSEQPKASYLETSIIQNTCLYLIVSNKQQSDKVASYAILHYPSQQSAFPNFRSCSPDPCVHADGMDGWMDGWMDGRTDG